MANFHLDHHQRKNEEDEAAATIIALAYLGKRGPIRTLRTYLTCEDISGHPRYSSPWTHLRQAGNDRAFITTMGVDVRTFEALLIPFESAWIWSTISRSDVNPNGAPQVARRSLDAAGELALLLHWLSSTMAGFSLHQIFSITPAVCARDLQHARECLLSVLRSLNISRICWPLTEAKCHKYSSMIERKFPLLTKCFGFVDGLNIPVNIVDDNK